VRSLPTRASLNSPTPPFDLDFYPRSSSYSPSPSFCTRQLSRPSRPFSPLSAERAHPFDYLSDTKNWVHTSPPLEIKGPRAASRERLWCVRFPPFSLCDPLALSSGPSSFPSHSRAFAILVIASRSSFLPPSFFPIEIASVVFGPTLQYTGRRTSAG